MNNNGILMTNTTVSDNKAGYSGGGIFLSTSNLKGIWLPLLSYQTLQTFYAKNVALERQVYDFTGKYVKGIAIFVNASTYFDRSLDYCCASLSVRNRQGDELLYADGWNYYLPGVHAAPLMLDGLDYVEVIFQDTMKDKSDGATREGRSVVLLYVIPLYEESIGINCISGNTAGQDGGGIMM